MSALPTKITYIKRCGNCNYDETYILRDINVNSSITDKSVSHIAMQHVGDTDSGHCEGCKLITQHTIVGYDLGNSL